MMRKLVLLLAILLIGCAAALGTRSGHVLDPVVPSQGSPEPQKDTKTVEKQQNSTQADQIDVSQKQTQEDQASRKVEVPSKHENSTQEDHVRGRGVEVPLKHGNSTQKNQPLKQEKSAQEDQASGDQENSAQDDQASGDLLKQEKSTQVPQKHDNSTEIEVPQKHENLTQVEVPLKQENPTKGSNGVEVPVPPKQENSTQEDEAVGGVEEKDSHCCGSRLRSCLSFSGDGSHGELSLHVHSHGDFNVKITPPSFLRVDPSEFKAEKGTQIPVNIEMLDSESAKLQTSAKIAIESEDGSCQIELPSSRSSLVRGFNYPSVRTEVVGVGFGMLAVALVVYGVGAYCSCWRRKQEGPRYQELEMADNSTASTNLEVSIPVEGWEWDEDWEEAEARKSLSCTASGSISSEGLASRKTTKEGWED